MQFCPLKVRSCWEIIVFKENIFSSTNYAHKTNSSNSSFLTKFEIQPQTNISI